MVRKVLTTEEVKQIELAFKSTERGTLRQGSSELPSVRKSNRTTEPSTSIANNPPANGRTESTPEFH